MRFIQKTSSVNKHDLQISIQNCASAQKEIITEEIPQKNTLRNMTENLMSKIVRQKFWKKVFTVTKNKVTEFYKGLDRKVVVTVSTVASAVAVVLVFNANFSFGYNAFINGVDLGYVPNKAYVQNCLDNINEEFSPYVSGRKIIMGKVAYVPSIVKKGNFIDEFNLGENIKSTSEVMVKAYAVEIDDTVYAALSDEQSAYKVLDEISAPYQANASTEVSFKENVSIVYEYVPAAILLSRTEAYDMLKSYTVEYKTVSASCTMSLTDFAYVNGIDKDELLKLNPGLKNYVDPSVEVALPVRKPIITVISSELVTHNTEIPFEETVIKDANMYEGTEVLSQKGVNGAMAVTEKVEKANGEVVSKTVVDKKVMSEPVIQLRTVGTKERPANVGTGTFIRPYYGAISSRFGSRRSGNHTGVDITGNLGDAIVAADNGTVVFSGWSGGYGNVVKIDHNNGYLTYYAHCDKLYVNVGDTVSKGETIAALGNTGNSTGPHVHFEIRYKDKVQNPMNYVD